MRGLVLVSVLLAGCADLPHPFDDEGECEAAQREFRQGPYASLTWGAEKRDWGTNRTQPRVLVPGDWWFPARLEVFGGDPNVSIPDPDPANEPERRRLDQISHERFARWLQANVTEDRPSIQMLKLEANRGYALVNVTSTPDAQWLLDEPYVANVYNYERNVRDVLCAG